METHPGEDKKRADESSCFPYRNEVDYERIKLLYQAGRHGLISGILIISCFPFFMINRVDHTILTIWTLMILGVNIPRFFLMRSFYRGLADKTITPQNIKRWEHYFILGFCISGVAWVVTAFLPYSGDIVLCLFFVVVVQVGINAVVVTMYSSSKNMVFLYLAITLIPTDLKIFMTGERPLIVVGIIGIIFFIILIRAVKLHNQKFIKIIRLKIENDELSKKDSLTGLWNRRLLYSAVEKLISRSIRHNESFSILLMDVDYFKKYNDSKGHAAGDALLQKISGLIQRTIREEDFAVRYGGEEFLSILPLAGIHETYAIGERIRKAIKSETNVTISGGVASFEPSKSFDEILVEADKRLYKAKKSGRDRIFPPFMVQEMCQSAG
ncbi:GGDEF domain-containing protein [Desulfospira joergensenii]|uniref:GGDEF domain-containing protein n=1 Tax=Desulfospira joergensenii TaxID=53329 RepID=UPI0003B4D12D|nr:GGDEF domain-containing protein [Desulfospira joergensenii]